jgi:hypothetical protein
VTQTMILVVEGTRVGRLAFLPLDHSASGSHTGLGGLHATRVTTRTVNGAAEKDRSRCAGLDVHQATVVATPSPE